jgi:hypothetical protein
MTITLMKDYFNLLQDKYGSPYHTDTEIETYLNRAQLDYVTDLLPPDGSELNIELNQNTIMRIHPILFTTGNVNMVSGTGAVLRTALDSAIVAATGITGAKLLRVLAIGWNDARPVTYTRKNNWYSYINNIFKAPSDKKPRTHEDGASWVFRPIDTTANLVFMGVRYPVSVSISGAIDCELPDLVHNDIVARALELAGIGSRDEMLAQLQKLNNA